LQSLQAVGHDGGVAGDTGLSLVLVEMVRTPVLPTPVVCSATNCLVESIGSGCC
jgi:hypothetical protein